jgi:hypothetical protein
MTGTSRVCQLYDSLTADLFWMSHKTTYFKGIKVGTHENI